MLTWLMYLAADLVVRTLPAGAADRLAIGFARLAFALRVPARARLEENLARLLEPGTGPPLEATAREAFDNFALSFTGFLRLGHAPRARWIGTVEVHGAEHLEAARASGRGVILLSAHLGNWELGAAWLAADGTPVHLVARPHASPWVERFYARRRRAWGVRLMPDRPLWRPAAVALRQREWVALMADRGTPERGTGRRASVCAWASVLARRTGALVLPAVIVRQPGGRHALHFERPLEPSAVRADGFAESLRRHLQRHPRQWSAFEPLPEGLA
jgi:Kdo2-lipid IVA lauroyltransferase/acyltransferase